jgi:hypothetical protein
MPSIAALSLATAGCFASNLADVSAGQVGCAPSEIQILDEVMGATSTWRAYCHGRTYQCSGTSQGVYPVQVACTVVPQAPVAVPTDPVGLSSVRRDKDPTGAVSLTVSFTAAQFRFAATAVPARAPAHALVSFAAPGELAGRTCELRIMVDGELLPPFERVAADQLAIRVPLAAVERFGPGHRVVGRYCGEEWYLGPKTQERLRELVTLWHEELRWLESERPTASPPPASPASPAPPGPAL